MNISVKSLTPSQLLLLDYRDIVNNKNDSVEVLIQDSIAMVAERIHAGLAEKSLKDDDILRYATIEKTLAGLAKTNKLVIDTERKRNKHKESNIDISLPPFLAQNIKDSNDDK